MLEEARIQICLEEWLLKLDVVKQDIENRERLYSEFTREKKNWSNLLQKVGCSALLGPWSSLALTYNPSLHSDGAEEAD